MAAEYHTTGFGSHVVSISITGIKKRVEKINALYL